MMSDAAHKPAADDLGAWCVRKGYATAEQIDECLNHQRERRAAGGPVPRLGEILTRKGILTPEKLSEALLEQNQAIRHCPRCDIRVNVPVRKDAAWYRCARCQGPLVEPSRSSRVDVVDDDFIVVSRDPLPPDVALAQHVPDRHFGKYLLMTEIGRGGVGLVHKAWDTFLSQYVALKRLRPSPFGETPEMFEERAFSLVREARNAIRLRHAHIVSIYDVGRINNEYYVSMEYLEGKSLHALLAEAKSRGKLSPFHEDPDGTLRLVAEVARAVHYAHTRPAPIVHCDLKPANILVDGSRQAHVVDFGLARNLATQIADTGVVSGTPSYMAPEQASGMTDRIDPRTDVYALGAVLYELLTGRPPFTGTTGEILESTVYRLPMPPGAVLTLRQESERASSLASPSLPAFLENLVLCCLEKDPELRPRDMQEVAAAIETRTWRKKGAPSPPASAPSPPSPAHGVKEAEIHDRLSRFDPEKAVQLAEAFAAEAAGGPNGKAALRAKDEALRVRRLKERTIRRLADAPPTLPELRLRRRTLRNVSLSRADGAGVEAAAGTSTVRLRWEEIEPSQMLHLVRTLLGESDEEDRLALALYCLRADRPWDAGELFSSIPEGPHAPTARAYLDEIERSKETVHEEDDPWIEKRR